MNVAELLGRWCGNPRHTRRHLKEFRVGSSERMTNLNPRRETGGFHLPFALTSLVLSVAVPAFAQQKGSTEWRMVQQRDLTGVAKALDDFGELNQKLDEAYNKSDAAGVAALFTTDALFASPDGMCSGQLDIENRHADKFRRCRFTNFNCSYDRSLLSSMDNAVWSAGQWTTTIQGKMDPVFSWGYWSAIYVREGNSWKFRMLTLIEHSRSTAP